MMASAQLPTGPLALHYDFDLPEERVANYGDDQSALPFGILEGHLIGGTGIFGTGLMAGASGVDSSWLDTGWPTNLYKNWTIGFWYDPGPGGGSGISHLFGDSSAYGFSCQIDLDLAPGDIRLSAPGYAGFNDVVLAGGASAPHYIHFSYDALEGAIRGYIDSLPVANIAQPFLAINGFQSDPASLLIGGYQGQQGLAPGALLDEFRVYHYTLSDEEIRASWNHDFDPQLPGVDVSAAGLDQPYYRDSPYTASEALVSLIRNSGASAIDLSISPVTAGISVDGPNPGSWTVVVDTGNLRSGEEIAVPVFSAYDMLDTGSYIFSTWVSLSGITDEVADNDTASLSLLHQFSVDFLPYRNRFEKFDAGGTAGAAPEGSLFEYWNAIPASGNTWIIEDASGLEENTADTGPLLDAGRKNRPGGNFALFTGTGSAFLNSPEIDLGSALAPRLLYSVHAYGSDIGSLHLQLDTGSGWLDLDSVIGPLQTSPEDPWQIRTADLTAFAGQTIRIRFEATGTGGTSEIAIDGFQFYDYYTEDAALSLPVIPEAGICGFSSEEDFGLSIENNGTDFLTGFDIVIEQTGPASNLFTVNAGTLIIPAGESARMLLEDVLDLSLPGAYTVRAWISVPGDTLPANDTVSATLLSTPAPAISAFPWTEDFSSFISWEETSWFGDTLDWWIMEPSVYPGSGAAGPARWRWSEGFLPSWITGPTDDHTEDGEGFLYLYPGSWEYTSSELYCPCLDLSATNSPALSVWYHMFGANMGELSLRVISEESGETEVFTRSGPQMSDNDDPWAQAVIDLSPWKNEVVRVLFKGKRKNLTSTYMSVDDVSVVEAFPNDVELLSIGEPEYRCGMSRNHRFTVSIQNNSLDTILSVPLQIDVTGPVPVSFSENASVIVPPLDFREYELLTEVDLSVHGDYTISAISSLPADAFSSNDTVQLLVSNTPSIVSLPIEEDFEGFTAGEPGLYGPGWNGDWWVEEDSVQNSPLTGPINDRTPGGQNYMYVEADWADVFLELRSVCLEVDSSRPLYASFWYYGYGNEIGKLDLDLYSGGKKVNAVGQLVGEQHLSEGLPWLREFVRLDGELKADDVMLVFEGRQDGNLSDHAIDDVRIFYADSLDAEASAISLLPTCNPDQTEVVATLFNHGLETLSVIPVEVSWNGPLSGSFTETVSGPVDPFSEVIVILDGTLDLSLPGDYDIQLRVLLPGDGLAVNDTAKLDVESSDPINSYPWEEDFETGIVGMNGALPDGWAVHPQRVPMWTIGQFETPSAETGPMIDHSPLGSKYIYLESTDPVHGGGSRLLSPCFDLSSPDLPNPWMRYWFHMYGEDMGDLVVDVISGDSAWLAVDFRFGELHSAGSEYTRVDIPLTPWENEKIQLRFRGFSGGESSDMALDDVSIFGATGTEAALIDALLVSPYCEVPQGQELHLRIRNDSGIPISGFDVGYDILGSAPQSYTENVGAFTIPAFDSAVYTLSAPVSITTGGIHRLRPFVQVSGDTNPTDDTLSWTYTWFPAPWLEDFEGASPGEPGILGNGWTSSPEDPANGWFPELSGTQNSLWTGPVMDHSSGAGQYVYLENLSFNPDIWHLTSPCISLDNSPGQTVSFWYHRYGLDMGDMLLEVEYAEGLWDTLGVLTGPSQFSELAPWGRFEYDVSGLADLSVRFRITGINGGLLSDMAVDDFQVGLLPSGIPETGALQDFDLRPNPASDQVLVTGAGLKDCTLEIRDVHGRLHFQETLDDGRFSVAGLPSGIYTVRLAADSGAEGVRKLVVQH